MSDFQTLKKQARELGYEGDKHREHVSEEQAVLRDERKSIRDLAAQREAQEADLLAQREQRQFEQARHDADLTVQKEQQENELLSAKDRLSKGSDDAAGDSVHSMFPPSFWPKRPTCNENKDDLDAYLSRSEKHTEACEWQTSWGIYLASLLSGKSISIYYSLSLSMTQDYDALKT